MSNLINFNGSSRTYVYIKFKLGEMYAFKGHVVQFILEDKQELKERIASQLSPMQIEDAIEVLNSSCPKITTTDHINYKKLLYRCMENWIDDEGAVGMEKVIKQ